MTDAADLPAGIGVLRQVPLYADAAEQAESLPEVEHALRDG
jgi:hypothetical protein